MNPETYVAMYKIEDFYWWYAGLKRLIVESIRSRLNSKRDVGLLDAGCGTGGLMVSLRRFGYCYGAEVSDIAISFCRKRGLDKIVKCSVDHLSFLDETFDFITSIDVLYHQSVNSEQNVLCGFYRLLKPGGYLILQLPAHEFLRNAHDDAVHTRKRYCIKEVKKLLKNCGFIVEKITYRNALLFFVLLIFRLFPRSSPDSVKKEGCFFQVPKLLNSILIKTSEVENFFLKRFKIYFGSSIFCIARKHG